MEKSPYRVTDKAPPRVAGKVVQAGDRLELTEPEARHELMTGAIRPWTEEAAPAAAVDVAPKPSSKPSRKGVEG